MEEQITIQWKRLDEIQEADWNPYRRTLDKYIKNLVENMRKNGFRSIYPIVIGKDGVVGDGHRRLAVARKLHNDNVEGFDLVPTVTDTNLTSYEIYMLQLDILKQTGKDLFDSIARGMPMEALPPKYQKQTKRIIEVAGSEAVYFMIDRKLSPSSIKWVELAIRYINRHAPDIKTDLKFGFKVLKWMFEYNETLGIQVFVREGKHVDKLLRAINSNRPLPRD